MKKEEFSTLLGEIDARYITEADTLPRPSHRLRWTLLAACLCLFLGGTTVYAASSHGAWITDLFTDRDESGYDLALMIEKIDTDTLSPQLRAVGSIIVRQYRESQPYDSHYPGSWDKAFSSAAEARDYIGCKALIGLDWALEETQTQLNVMGTPDGKLQSIHLETDYTVGDIRLQAYTQLYTEHYTGELTTGLRAAEEISFTPTEETNDVGLPWLLVRSSPMESGWAGLDGYLVRDGVLYKLHIAYLAKDAAEAEGLMRQWADCF